MRRSGTPIPWNPGDPLTARHLDYNRRVLADLVTHRGPRQLDEPPTSSDEQPSPAALGNMTFVSKTTRDETVSILDDTETEVGTATVEVTTAVKVSQSGNIIWIYLE